MADNLRWQITFGGVADNFGGGEIHLSHYASSGTKKKRKNRRNYFDWG